MQENELAGEIIGAAIEVHKEIGPGLLESAYQDCLEYELRLRGLDVENQVPIAVAYKGLMIGEAYRADLLVANKVIIELKSVEQVKDVHKAQLLTYLKLTNRRLGLLVNFCVPLMKNGIYRVVNKL